VSVPRILAGSDVSNKRLVGVGSSAARTLVVDFATVGGFFRASYSLRLSRGANSPGRGGFAGGLGSISDV
jgi:hypothetical protein